MSGHAKVSPSGASRWMKCTMAPSLEAQFPDQTSSYAEEGTLAHELAEFHARTSTGMSYSKAPPKALDQDMEEAAELYAQFIKETYLKLKENCPDTYINTEILLDLSDWIPEGFGTADCLIIADGTLYVIDFKYGKGVKVEAENNKQMQIYALGALKWADMLYDIDTVRMVIIQPRLGGISEWELPATDLYAWGGAFLKPAAEAAYYGKGEFCPGEDTCRFCKAAGHCKAQSDYFLALFDENEDLEMITAEDAGRILQKADGMRSWLASIEAMVKNSLMEGEPVDGWKLVEGRSTRKYTDEAEIEKRLRAHKYKVSEIFEKKLLGISKMEKLLGKKKMGELIGDLIEKPRGSAVIAPASDKRPEYLPKERLLDEFDD